MKIYLCRHGETTGDVEDRYGGDYDDHLTDLGKTQAQQLGERLRTKGIQKLFTSSRIRAVETAEIFGKIFACEMEVIDDLRERNQYGILTGMVKAEAKEKYPDLPEKFKDYRNTIAEAEAYAPFLDRVNRAIQKIADLNLDTVAVVTHGGPIKAILRQIEYSFDYKLENCAFAELEVKAGKVTVISLNGIHASS